MPLLRLDRTSAGYGERHILDNVKLSLSPGDRIALLGANGAGKSTLIKLLAGTLAPLTGERIAARDLAIGYFAQHQLEQLDSDSPRRSSTCCDSTAASANAARAISSAASVSPANARSNRSRRSPAAKRRACASR